jgi:uncharacterized caspase-like protein
MRAMRIFKALIWGTLVPILLLAQDALAQTQKRVALVIGNSNYANVKALPNPTNDATAVADLFREAGFDTVDARLNLSANDMRRAIRDFSDKARDADVAVVFYAGHGIEIDGTNYLLPVDSTLERDIDVEDEAVSLDRILKILEPARKLRLVILDACRDNPFTRSMRRTSETRSIGRGLARVEPPSSDTLIAFAAKAGSTAADGTGSHSPFTTALLKNIVIPGLDLRLAFGRVRDAVLASTGHRQEPFVYGSLGGTTVALVPPAPEAKPAAAPPPLAPVATPAPAVDATASARRDYEFAAQVGTKEAWDSFLAVHSSGFYADLARAQRTKILAEQAKPPAVALPAPAPAPARVPPKPIPPPAAPVASSTPVVPNPSAPPLVAPALATVAPALTPPRPAAPSPAPAPAPATSGPSLLPPLPAAPAAVPPPPATGPTVIGALQPATLPEPRKPASDGFETVRLMQTELKRLGCYKGDPNQPWSDDTRRALETFNRIARKQLDVQTASLGSLEVLRARTSSVCPLQCGRGFVLGESGECEKRKPKSRTASRPESRGTTERKTREPASSGGASVVCGDVGGCQSVPKGCRGENRAFGQGSVGVVVCGR